MFGWNNPHLGICDYPFISILIMDNQDLKSSNQRDEIAAARASLKENSSLLHSVCSACLEHSDVASLKTSKDSICNEMQNALNVISNASQGVGNKMGQPASHTATLGSALDELENLIVLDPLVVNEDKIRPSLEKRLEAIISGAALLADSSCTRDFHRERIIAECNAIRQALQDLLSEYINNASSYLSVASGTCNVPEAPYAISATFENPGWQLVCQGAV
ncbi:PREDICTED: catenin alpha-3 [Leptosomus discolor]|uniref:catenin alpha-3 n=1 Tax=Leptosomus discolor TaxID=188344 RepID=UPI0005228B96|nr:PREDICTED: catenin alpha-3 [Leptosomus discolor]